MRQLLFYYTLSQYNTFCHETVAFRNKKTLFFMLQNKAIIAS